MPIPEWVGVVLVLVWAAMFVWHALQEWRG